MDAAPDTARIAPHRRLVDLLQYAAFRALEMFALSMPPDTADGVADLFGAAHYAVDGRRRRTALENLRIAFGDSMTGAAREAIARRAFVHAYRIGAEAFRRPRVLRDAREFDRRGTYPGDKEPLRADYEAGRAGVFFTGHIGNWELAAACLRAQGLPLAIVARSFGNPLLDAYVSRSRGGAEVVMYKAGAVKASSRALARGLWVGLLADQNAGHRGEFVPFFGVPASTHASAAVIAVREARPVYFGAAMRRGPRYRYDYFVHRHAVDPAGDEEGEVRRVLEAFHAFLEERIRERPEQYFWLHRRWKTRPPGEASSDRLPNYPGDDRRRTRRAGPPAPVPTT